MSPILSEFGHNLMNLTSEDQIEVPIEIADVSPQKTTPEISPLEP